jgi:predicted NUDIX family phosphoesterase
MRREIDEEVEIKSPGHVSRIGLINDDSTPVGEVHLGVVHLFELEHPHVLPREEGLADPEFLPLSTVWEIRDQYETWSQICVDSFLRGGRNCSD